MFGKWWLLGLAVMAAGCCTSPTARQAPDPALAKLRQEYRREAPKKEIRTIDAEAEPVAPAVTPVEGQFVSVDRRGFVWIHADDAEVREVAGEIARAGRLNLIVDPSVVAHVTLDTQGQHPREALELVARASGCEIEEWHPHR